VPVFKEKPERYKFILWTNSLENFSLKNKAGFELHRRSLKEASETTNFYFFLHFLQHNMAEQILFYFILF